MSEAKWVRQTIEFDLYDGMVDQFKAVFKDAVRDEFKHAMSYFDMPIEFAPKCDGYGNPPVEDPLTIRFGTTAFSDINGMSFETSLTDIIDEIIDMHRYIREEGTVIDKESAVMFTRLAQGLQNEVNKLNKLIDNAIDVEE